jgi:hypothetical protein
LKGAATPLRSPRWSALGCAAALLLLPGAALRADTPADRPSSAQILDQFRRAIWADPVYAEVELRQMPRRGDETTWRGRFWGGRDAQGPVTRLELDGPGGRGSVRFLVQGGPNPRVWAAGPGGEGAPVGNLLAPLLPGLEMAPVDVLPMPYLFWMDAELSGLERIRGRPAYVFTLSPDGDFRAANPGVRSVRAYLDTQYDALVQSEVDGPGGSPTRTLSLLDLRKVGDRWIPKDLEVRTEATRNKTRLSLVAVAVGWEPAPDAFDPARLGIDLAPPPSGRLERVGP